MTKCVRYVRVWWLYDTDNARVKVGRLRCKQWKCDHCARENMKMWRKHLNKRLPAISGQWWLMTLTAPGDKRERLESYKALQHGIDVLLKRFRRAFGKVDYVRIYEKHPKSNALHGHFIITGVNDFVLVEKSKNGRFRYKATNFRKGKRGYWSLRTFVKKTAQSCGMGYIADIRSLGQTSRAVKYVTEYMTKDAQDFEIKGLRHVAASRKVGSPKRENDDFIYSGYRLNKGDIPAGLGVVDADTGEKIPDDYWKDGNVYPPLNEGK